MLVSSQYVLFISHILLVEWDGGAGRTPFGARHGVTYWNISWKFMFGTS